jgi:cell division protein FtsB
VVAVIDSTLAQILGTLHQLSEECAKLQAQVEERDARVKDLEQQATALHMALVDRDANDTPKEVTSGPEPHVQQRGR